MDADSKDTAYYRGTRMGTKLKPFQYGTLEGVKLDILRADEVKPCLCGSKAVLIMDGMIEFRFGVFCTNPACVKYHPAQYSWFGDVDKAVDEWNKEVTTLTETKTG